MFKDMFVLLVDEQFYLSLISSTGVVDTLIFSFVKALLYVISVLAGIYMMWKIIMNMPEFIFKLVGLDNLSSTSSIANNIEQNISRSKFIA